MLSVPYYDDGNVIAKHVEKGIAEMPEDTGKRILLIHYGIQGAKIGPGDYVLPCELKLPMLQPDKWDIIFSGHYHIGQQIGPNFHYIGSAMQHRWDDAGFDKSFIVYDTDTGNIERVLTKAPKFVVTDSKLNSEVDNCFVRVSIDGSMTDEEKEDCTRRALSAGAISVEFKLNPKKAEAQKERISFSEESGFYGIVEDYVNSDVVDKLGIDTEELIHMGKDIIKRAI